MVEARQKRGREMSWRQCLRAVGLMLGHRSAPQHCQTRSEASDAGAKDQLTFSAVGSSSTTFSGVPAADIFGLVCSCEGRVKGSGLIAEILIKDGSCPKSVPWPGWATFWGSVLPSADMTHCVRCRGPLQAHREVDECTFRQGSEGPPHEDSTALQRVTKHCDLVLVTSPLQRHSAYDRDTLRWMPGLPTL